MAEMYENRSGGQINPHIGYGSCRYVEGGAIVLDNRDFEFTVVVVIPEPGMSSENLIKPC